MASGCSRALCCVHTLNSESASTSARHLIRRQTKMLSKEEPYYLQGTRCLVVFQPSFSPQHFLSERSCLANLMFISPLISGIIVSWNLSLIHLHPHKMPSLQPVPLHCTPLAPYVSLSLAYHITPLCIVYHLFCYYFPNYLADSWKVKTAFYSL